MWSVRAVMIYDHASMWTFCIWLMYCLTDATIIFHRCVFHKVVYSQFRSGEPFECCYNKGLTEEDYMPKIITIGTHLLKMSSSWTQCISMCDMYNIGVCFDFTLTSFGASALFVEWQERHPTWQKSCTDNSKGSFGDLFVILPDVEWSLEK